MEPLNRFVPGIVEALVRRAPLSPEKVTFAWRAAAGPAMARVATVQLASDGSVHVHCPDDHWRSEIRRSAPLLRDRLRGLLGDEVVRQIKVGPRSTGRRRAAGHDSHQTGSPGDAAPRARQRRRS